MGDIAEQVRVERQRAKRQQRILASAASRLLKITSSQAAIRGGKEETHDTEQTKNSIAEHYPSPADPRRKKYEAELEAHFCDEHRPLVKELVKDRKFDEDEENMLLTGKIPLSLLEDNKHTPKAKTSTFEDDFMAYTKKYTNKNDKYWHLLHFVSMVWLGVLATYQVISEHGLNQVRTLFTQGQTMDLNSYYPVFWYFIILEVIMHFGRVVYHHPITGLDDKTSLIYKALTHLRYKSAQSKFYWGLTSSIILQTALKDLCLVLFVIGFIVSIIIAL